MTTDNKRNKKNDKKQNKREIFVPNDKAAPQFTYRK